MSQYKTGTASVTNGSSTVTGSGTLWLANTSIGNLFAVFGDEVLYTIASINSDTSYTLTAPYGGATGSGKVYSVTRDFTPNLSLPLLAVTDLNTNSNYNELAKLMDNLGLGNLGTAAFTDLTSPTATIFDNGNLNSDLFDGTASNQAVLVGVSQSATTAIFYANTSLMNVASNITYSGAFKVFNMVTGLDVGTGYTSLIASSSRTPKLTRLVITSGLSGISAGDPLELRCDGAAASILIKE